MDSPHWSEHTDFTTRVWRALGFALPTGLLLGMTYAFVTAVLSGCGGPLIDRSIEPVNLLFRMLLNCFLTALSPVLFCLYEGRTCWHHRSSLENYAIIEFIATGLIPIIIYSVVARKRGWLPRRTFNLENISGRKSAITGLTILVLLPFADHILGAPARMAESFRWLSLTGGKSSERLNAMTARTQSIHLAKLDRTQEAMTILLAAIDDDITYLGLGHREFVYWNFYCLSYFDKQKKLTAKEWLTMCAPLEVRLSNILENIKNSDGQGRGQPWELVKLLISQHFCHGAINEGLEWMKVAHKYERVVHGETSDYEAIDSAGLAHSIGADTEALETLQYAIALSESLCINDLRTETEKSQPYARFDKALAWELYKDIVEELPANSDRKRALAKWLHCRELHQKACDLIEAKQYPEAERILLAAAPFDTSDKSCLRAWSIYQNLLGSIELKLNKFEAADKHFQLALANDSFAVEGNEYCAEIARDLAYCAELMQKQGRLTAAEGVLSRALEIDTKVLGENASESKALQEKLIAAYGLSHKYDLIEAIYKNDVRRADDERYTSTVRVDRITKLAGFYLSRSQYAKAEEQLVRAIEANANGCIYPSVIVPSLDELGDAYLAVKNYPKALLQYERAYQFCYHRHALVHSYAERFDKFAKLFTATKEFDKANDAAETALSMRKKEHAPDAEIQLAEQACLAIKEQAKREGFPLKSGEIGDSPLAVPRRQTTTPRPS